MHRPEGVHLLALILVKALDLNVEHRLRIHVHALAGLEVGGEVFLVRGLDLAEGFEHRGVVPVGKELL